MKTPSEVDVVKMSTRWSLTHFTLGCWILLSLSACHPSSLHQPVTPTALRVTMGDLHRSGGVPHGWQFTLPPGNPAAGRQAFIDFGCFNCHTVMREQFPAPSGELNNAGPDLTGMGRHHPASYFAES